MPTNRKITFVNDHIYHVFNRGIERRPTFMNKYDYSRMLQTIRFYQFSKVPIRLSQYLNLPEEEKNQFLLSTQNILPKQVEIIAYCLMPNHFHFLLQQKEEQGISKFMANIANSYTKYFNTKKNRVGPLFQGIFKAVLIESTEQLVHVSRYIHLNPVSSSLISVSELNNYMWSSYPHYIHHENNCFVHKEVVLEHFRTKEQYQEFITNYASYARELEKIKHLILEQ